MVKAAPMPMAPAAIAELLSLVPALECRFCGERLAKDLILEAHALRTRGLQLFSHAVDNIP